MHVHTGKMRSGANKTYTAAEHADDGASTLSRVGINATIFGDFNEALSFHGAVSAAHRRHVTLIERHIENLGIIGEKAHDAADDFDAMEEHNRIELRGVCGPV